MKKFLAVIIALVLCMGVLAGCKKEEAKPSVNDAAVYGTWSEDFFDSGYVFNEDGTGFDTFWNLSFTFTADGEHMRLTYDDELWGSSDYTYTVSGDTLTMVRVVEGEDEADEFVYKKQGSAPKAPEGETTEGETGESQQGEDTSE